MLMKVLKKDISKILTRAEINVSTQRLSLKKKKVLVIFLLRASEMTQ